MDNTEEEKDRQENVETKLKTKSRDKTQVKKV